MKLDQYNRLMAIARSPEYKKDWQVLVKLHDKNGVSTDPELVQKIADKVSAKWKLISPIPPFITNKHRLYFNLHKRRPVTEADLDPSLAKEYMKMGLLHHTYTLKAYPPVLDVKDRYLFVRLKIDLTSTRKELLNGFEKTIDTWFKRYAKFRGKRQRKTKYDPWRVYDIHMAHPENNFNRIGIYLSKRDKHPHEQKQYAARAKKAFDRAVEMIRHVEKEARK